MSYTKLHHGDLLLYVTVIFLVITKTLANKPQKYYLKRNITPDLRGRLRERNRTHLMQICRGGEDTGGGMGIGQTWGEGLGSPFGTGTARPWGALSAAGAARAWGSPRGRGRGGRRRGQVREQSQDGGDEGDGDPLTAVPAGGVGLRDPPWLAMASSAGIGKLPRDGGGANIGEAAVV